MSGAHPGRAEQREATRRALRRCRSRTGALRRGHFDHAAVQSVPFHAQPRWAQRSFLRSRGHFSALTGTEVGGIRKWRPPCAFVVPIHHASMKACSHADSSLANCCTARACGCRNFAASQSLASVDRDSASAAASAVDSSHCEQPEQVKPHEHFFSHGKGLPSHKSLHGRSETPALTMALK